MRGNEGGFPVGALIGRFLIVGLMLWVSVAIMGSASAGVAWFDQLTDNVQISGQTTLSTACTYEAVIMLTGSAPKSRIFNEWTYGMEDKQLQVATNGVGGSSYYYEGGNSLLFCETDVPLKVWIHVAFCFDGTEERLYLDGQLVDHRNRLNPILNASGLPYLGALYRDDRVDPSFLGYLDSIRISDTARYSGTNFTPARGDFSNDANTLILFNFKEAEGSTMIADESSYVRTGTLGSGFAGATRPLLGQHVAEEGTVLVIR